MVTWFLTKESTHILIPALLEQKRKVHYAGLYNNLLCKIPLLGEINARTVCIKSGVQYPGAFFFVIGEVNSILNLPDKQDEILGEFKLKNYRKTNIVRIPY